jgi:hypothetical protein
MMGCLFVASVNLHAEEVAQQDEQKKTSFVNVPDIELRKLILDLYAQANEDQYAEKLPEDFKVVHKALQKGLNVSRGVLEYALLSIGESIDASRAPRQDAPGMGSSIEPVGPGCCCDLTQVERLLAIIRSRIGTTNDDVCDQSVLGILGNACEILGVNISTALKEILDILDLIVIENSCSTILRPEDILSNGFTVTSPGYYTLCGSVGFDAPVTPSCVIRIQTSNVTFDFNQNSIYQTDADAGLVAVCVDSGFDNIVIKNGKISGVTGSGITIADDSQDIIVSGMTVRGCGGDGISFSGTTGSRNRDVIIEDSQFTNNGGNGGTFTFTEKIKISNSKFNDNVTIGASFSSSSGNEIADSIFNQNGGASNAAGLSLDATGSSIIRNCTFNGNFSTTGTARGLLLTSTGNLVDNCVADGNSSSVSAGFAIGFDVDGTAHLLSNCSASGNSAVTGGGSIGVGFRLQSTAFRCLVKNGTSLTNSARGFQNDATATYNLFVGNFAFGHIGNTNNYFGSGLGFISVGAGAQPPAGSFDERAVSNISVI